jgi:molybdopterin-containing oxidoreductase family iron-sulfur binding subunit
MAKITDPVRIQAVIAACHVEHNVPDVPAPRDVKWIWTDSYERVFHGVANEHAPYAVRNRPYFLLCNHCTNPPCVRVCPTRATFSRPDGIVEMDYHRCIGCRFCMAGCPYGARSFNYFDPLLFLKETNPAFPRRTAGVVEKCTFCTKRLSEGRPPACVEASEGAILFGDLQDPSSHVRQVLASSYSIQRGPSLGTQPSVYYLV